MAYTYKITATTLTDDINKLTPYGALGYLHEAIVRGLQALYGITAKEAEDMYRLFSDKIIKETSPTPEAWKRYYTTHPEKID